MYEKYECLDNSIGNQYIDINFLQCMQHLMAWLLIQDFCSDLRPLDGFSL